MDAPPIRAFLCHSSGDKATVRNLYLRLKDEGFLPWLDEEDLIAGQDWEYEIKKAVHQSDTVVVCLSRSSINKAGFIQKELMYAIDVADQQPEGSIFIIPLKLEQCDVPERLARFHWIDYFEDGGHERLVRALQVKRLAGQARIHSDTQIPRSSTGGAPLHRQVGRAGQEPTVPAKSSWLSQSWERLALLIFAVCFLLTLIVLAINFPEPTSFQLTVFRVILSLAAAGFAAFIPGLIEFEIKPALRAGGALGVFAIVYFTNPGQLLVTKSQPIVVRNGDKKTVAEVSEQDIADYYRKNPGAFEKYNLERLFVPEKVAEDWIPQGAEDDEADMAKLARRLRARAAAGEDFGKLQKEAFKAAGMKIAPPTVDMLKVRLTSLPPGHAVFDTQKYTVSHVINDSSGYYIYKVDAKEQLPLDQVKDEIRAALQNQRLTSR